MLARRHPSLITTSGNYQHSRDGEAEREAEHRSLRNSRLRAGLSPPPGNVNELSHRFGWNTDVSPTLA